MKPTNDRKRVTREQTSIGAWIRTYHTPDGTSQTSRWVPPCEPGPRTAAALEKYADAL